MSDSKRLRLLVTGASGHLGRRVVELLLEAGAHDVVAATRKPEALADLAARGAQVRRADFDDPQSLDIAFADVDRVLIISTDALGVPGQRLRQHANAVAAAKRAKLGHIVYTSMANPEPGSPLPFAPDHYETERLIVDSGISHTILRVNWYAEVLFMVLPQALKHGQWLTSAGEGRTAYVAREDVARAAAAALSAPAAASRRLEITGPRPVSAAQLVEIAGAVFDKPIALAPLSDDQLQDGLTAAQLPAPLVELIVAIDRASREGRLDVSSDAVAALTGAPPRSVKEFMIENRDAFLAASQA